MEVLQQDESHTRALKVGAWIGGATAGKNLPYKLTNKQQQQQQQQSTAAQFLNLGVRSDRTMFMTTD